MRIIILEAAHTGGFIKRFCLISFCILCLWAMGWVVGHYHLINIIYANLCIFFLSIEPQVASPNDNFFYLVQTAKLRRGHTIPLESIGAYSAILPRWNRSFHLRFDLGKTSSDLSEISGLPRFFAVGNTAVKNRMRWSLNSLLFPLFRRLINFNRRDVVHR